MNKFTVITIAFLLALVACSPRTLAPFQIASSSLPPTITSVPLPSQTSTQVLQRTVKPPIDTLPTLFSGHLTPGFKQTQIATGTAAAATRIANREATARAKLLNEVMTATPPEIIASHLSPDGNSRAEVVRYECVNTGEVEQIAYELLRLVHPADGVETTVADQLQYCGGLGAYGLGFVYWSSNSRYLYYTDSAQGMPDGWGLGWYRSLFRYDLLNGKTTELRWGPMAPDGITMAYADPHELALYIWDMDKGEVARVPSSFTAGAYGPAIYGLTWSPDGKSLVYAETTNAYESTDAKSWIVFIYLATFDRQVIYRSESGMLNCCIWENQVQIQFQMDDSELQVLSLPPIAPGEITPTSLWCERPEDLQETQVALSRLPGAPKSFCIVWAESATPVSGYRVELKYDGSGEVFEYTTGPYGTQWIVPFEYQPRLDESMEQFIRRYSYSVNVYALSTQGEALVGTTSVEIDNPDFLSLPTATITP